MFSAPHRVLSKYSERLSVVRQKLPQKHAEQALESLIKISYEAYASNSMKLLYFSSVQAARCKLLRQYKFQHRFPHSAVESNYFAFANKLDADEE